MRVIIISILVVMNSINAKSQELILTDILQNDFVQQLPDADQWNKNREEYIPDNAALSILKEKAGSFDLVIILGTWCEDSRIYFPQFIKVMEMSSAMFKSIKIIGVDRDKKCNLAGFEKLGVLYVPTFILQKDGVEVKRIVETPEISVEKDLANAMN